MKKIAILGSTGSIGRNTLDVVSRNRKDFRVVGLSAGKNIELLEEQIKAFSPEIVAVADSSAADFLKKKNKGVKIFSGADGIQKVASYKNTDFVMSAIVGSAGLLPTITAIRSGKTIGLANKEALVMAGEIVIKEAKKNKAKIIPVDSEHSAVFQCIHGHSKAELKRIILTASGGPFVDRSREELKDIKADDALRHPNWDMGRKISIDSATLMNKGLEVIEASWLFGLPAEKIDVLVHPQSIVHSMVEFTDRSFLAQMSVPDMKGPIAYALSYPDRNKDPILGLELDKIGTLTFKKPDNENFPCISYAYDALNAGGTMASVLNASNEIAVETFLNNKIGFNDIPLVIRKTMEKHSVKKLSSVEDVLEADRWARETAKKIIKELKG